MSYIDHNYEISEWPADRKPGCLKRKSKLGEWCPLASEHIPLIPRSDWASLAKTQTLRPFVPYVHDQDGVGSCATEMTAEGIELVESFRGLTPEELNPWYIYHTTSGGRDSGSSIDENLVFAQKYGCAPVRVWPREKGWRATPSEEARVEALKHRIGEFYDIATEEEAVSALLQGFAVGYGAKGHAVLKIAYDQDLNSWGRDWGENGFGLWAPVSRINWSYGAFAIRTTQEG